MKQSILDKLTTLAKRRAEIGVILANNYSNAFDQNTFRDLSKEYSDLEEIVRVFEEYQHITEHTESTINLTKDPDEELRLLAQEELKILSVNQEEVEQQLKTLLLPADPNDGQNVFLEIRAGAGGNEAALFSSDLFRMYCRYAERNKWKVEILNESFAEQGGYKEIILRIIGKRVFSRLKFESGVHRVQRVPVTEAQGRIHTSTCTVAVLPEVEKVECVDIANSDLRIDTFRASGAGGQHVNRTDSAVRITHIPTGVVVECQDDRSQHRNKAKAMSLLQAKILAKEQEKQQTEIDSKRRNLIGSGDRSERIRTYNFPQGRVTDHRINLTIYNLPNIIDGELDQIIDPLVLAYQNDFSEKL
ncbi:MAG: peptide chain release factor 1 [Gammaproteobacteria bacterium]|jgi:peptide chain release factor 1